ncbi:hypothetical protein HOY80DRAFT_312753 [Tuber brumale]|nr:hypothetical protein HOY80DRAFT_312753 [Tuber brumale]
MKSPFYIAPLLFLQFVNLTRALPWDPPTCPLAAPQPTPAQRVLQPDGNTGNNTAPPVTKMLDRLLPRQTTICQRVTCNSLYYCCNDQTCTYSSAQALWRCQYPTRTLTVTSTYRSTSTSISTTTHTITATTTVDTRTVWTYITSTGTWTTTDVVTSTATETSSVTSSITLTRRGMPTPTRCVRRSEGEGGWRGLAKRQGTTIFVTTTVTVTATPASTFYMTTTWLTTYWISRTWTTTRTSFIGLARTFTVTSTYTATTTATATATETTTVSRKGMSVGAKVGAGVGGGVGGLAVVALLVVLIWKKVTKPTAEEEWAGNQAVEDRTVQPGNMEHGAAIVGAGGTLLAAGATDKIYQEPYEYKAGYYSQDAGMGSPPLPPPVAYFQPYEQPGQYLEGYPELDPNAIHTIPRRPIPGSPAPPSYRGSGGAGSAT